MISESSTPADQMKNILHLMDREADLKKKLQEVQEDLAIACNKLYCTPLVTNPFVYKGVKYYLGAGEITRMEITVIE